MSGPAHIAVLGDLHGHFVLAYRLLARWERETGKKIDLILQVGDLGAYPDPSRADSATRRFAEKDPDELSFADFYAGEGQALEVFRNGSYEPADMLFIKGNHEDFDFLHDIGSGPPPIPVDAFSKILFLPSGTVTELLPYGIPLRVAALGGIAVDGGAHHDSVSKHYTHREVLRLLGAGEVDVLLTHDGILGELGGLEPSLSSAGSGEIASLVRDLQPSFHFFGHYHCRGRELPQVGRTRSIHLNEVNFQGRLRLRPGCIGILSWATDHSSFEFVEDEWLAEFTRDSFRTR